MSDIFISYKKEDAGRVVRIVEALRAEGFSVWWDHGIAPGANWDKTIQDQLDKAKAVVAVWSELSRDAPWVKEESGVGKNRGILVPIRIDDVEPPLGFGLIQAVDLIDWKGDTKDPRWGHFTAGLKAVLSGKGAGGGDTPLTRRARANRNLAAWAIAGAITVIGLLIAAGLFLRPAAPVATGPQGPALVVPGAPAPTTAQTASPAEVKVWEKANTEKTRAAFQSYLIAYPNGAFANRARDALLTCRTESREVWKENQMVGDQPVRGVGTMPQDGKTEKEACAAATAMARKQSETNCDAITNNAGYRKVSLTFQERACGCNQTSPIVTVCVLDTTYRCRFENKVPESVEICGG